MRVLTPVCAGAHRHTRGLWGVDTRGRTDESEFAVAFWAAGFAFGKQAMLEALRRCG